jgi:hypothetical protein
MIFNKLSKECQVNQGRLTAGKGSVQLASLH